MEELQELFRVETQLNIVRKVSPWEMRAYIKTHASDFTKELEDSFFEAGDSGETIILVWYRFKERKEEPEPQHFPPTPISENKERDPLAVKRQSLALNIKKYAIQFKRTEQSVIDEIYARYRIKSRSELTAVELDYEIKRYKPFTDEELREHW